MTSDMRHHRKTLTYLLIYTHHQLPNVTDYLLTESQQVQRPLTQVNHGYQLDYKYKFFGKAKPRYLKDAAAKTIQSSILDSETCRQTHRQTER